MDNNTLGLATQPCITICHGQRDHFIRACDDAGKLVRHFLVAVDHRLQHAWMIRAQIDEAVLDPGLDQGLKEGERGSIPFIVSQRMCSNSDKYKIQVPSKARTVYSHDGGLLLSCFEHT